MNKKDTLSGRLAHALEVTGIRKVELARAINVKPQVIQFLCTSETKSSRFTFEIATALGLNSTWLATGEGEMFLADDPTHQLVSRFQRIPVLTFEQVQQKIEGKPLDLSNQKTWEAVDGALEGNFFCVKMPDGSMEPFVPAGATLLVRELTSTKIPAVETCVLAYAPQFSVIMVREIKARGGDLFLVPRNTDLFKRIQLTKDVRLLGVVIECRSQLRA